MPVSSNTWLNFLVTKSRILSDLVIGLRATLNENGPNYSNPTSKRRKYERIRIQLKEPSNK